MRTYPYFLASFNVILIFSILFATGCGGGNNDDPQPTALETERVMKLLGGSTWKMQTVNVDGVDQTKVYQGLTISFSGTSFTASQGGVVWPVSGTYQFSDDTAKSFDRNDGVRITIEQISETGLSLGLVWNSTSLGAGRVTSVKGKHTFLFGK